MSANMHKTFGGGTEIAGEREAVTGLAAGNNILTMTGYVKVEDLKAGDRIITRNGARILRELVATTHMMRPIKVGSNTLGYSRPASEMLMAPDQEVMVRDWRAEVLFGEDFVITRINRMVDGKYISESAVLAEHTVYELCFDEEEIYYADGVEIISALSLSKNEAKQAQLAA